MTNVDDEDIKELVTKYNVFGRVRPNQKKLIIKALQEQGHVVAMTGDGVNDIMALREADCSIAVASGSDAAKNVSQLVLLDSNFDSLPQIVLEGRKSINNIEKTSALFLTKTFYATVLTLLFILIPFQYPFSPIQLTLISFLTIGVPSFYLGLQANKDIVHKGFFRNICNNCLPGGIIMVIDVIIVILLALLLDIKSADISTLCVLLGGVVGFSVLLKLMRPFNILKKIIYGVLLTLFIVAFIFFREVFSLTLLGVEETIIFVALSFLTLIGYNYISNFIVNFK